jgi:GDP-L-fucose synthase
MDQIYSIEGKRVWVAGHKGMVGSAVVRCLAQESIAELLTSSSSEVDLRNQADTESYILRAQPDLVILAAALVGGINANQTAPADFLYDNLMIATNVLKSSKDLGVERVVLLGSSCIYPRDCPQPISENYLLTGPLEPTNEGYALAKIAALMLGRMYRQQYGLDVISLMPTNLYGQGDSYDPQNSHVLPALIKKVHDAKEANKASITLWGSGKPYREFLHVDDLAEAIIFATKYYSEDTHLNVGSGRELSINELAIQVSEVLGWHGTITFDTSMPDGTPRKLLDTTRLNRLGWVSKIPLKKGILMAYQDYLSDKGHFKHQGNTK